MQKAARSTPSVVWFFFAILLLFISTPACAAPKLLSNGRLDRATIRVLSLKALQERAKACTQTNSCSDEVYQLAGLKQIAGYVIDEENQDILLIGYTGQDLPPLYLEDFVIALRATWLKYAKLKRGNVREYTDPGCSIDPNPHTLKKLKQIARKISSNTSSEQIEKQLELWHKTCEGQQSVRVLGIPFNTRFAEVMVKADYDMKSIVDGTDLLGIPGLVSMPDMKLAHIQRALKANKPIAVSLAGMNRFWFYPGKNIYEEDEGIVLIKQCPVTLLTEAMYVSASGQYGAGQGADAFAQQFTQSFSKLYGKVAEERPVYQEIENLFRFVAFAKIIKFTSAHKKAGLDLTFLLEEFPVSRTKVNPSLPGKSAVTAFQHRQDYAGGYQIAKFWLPSCGGVSIAIQPQSGNFIQNTHARLRRLRRKILGQKRSGNALSTDIHAGAEQEIISNQISDWMAELNQSSENFTALTIVDKGSTYEVYQGVNDPVYTTEADLSKLMNTIATNMGKSLKNSVHIEVLDSRGRPSKDKLKAVETTSKIHLNRGDQRITIRNFSERSSDIPLQEVYFSRGITFDKHGSTIEAIKPDAEGNRFQVKTRFLTKVRGEFRRLTVYIKTKTRKAAEKILNYIRRHFQRQPHDTDSTFDFINKVLRKLEKDPSFKKENPVIQIKGSQIGTIFRKQRERVA